MQVYGPQLNRHTTPILLLGEQHHGGQGLI
jgi:hypothetical protein